MRLAKMLMDLTELIAEHPIKTLLIAGLGVFFTAFIKKLVIEEYDAIVRALASMVFGGTAVWCFMTGAAPSVRTSFDEMIDHFNAAVKRGDGGVSTMMHLTAGMARRANRRLVFILMMGTTRAYAIAGVRFLKIYQADDVQKWRLLRFVAHQRRRVRRIGIEKTQ